MIMVRLYFMTFWHRDAGFGLLVHPSSNLKPGRPGQVLRFDILDSRRSHHMTNVSRFTANRPLLNARRLRKRQVDKFLRRRKRLVGIAGVLGELEEIVEAGHIQLTLPGENAQLGIGIVGNQLIDDGLRLSRDLLNDPRNFAAILGIVNEPHGRGLRPQIAHDGVLVVLAHSRRTTST